MMQNSEAGTAKYSGRHIDGMTTKERSSFCKARDLAALSLITMCLIALLLTLLWGSAKAATDVCGSINQGEAWSLADSPVRVSCDLDVASLTIEPGVEVHVTGDYEIVVAGEINVRGTEEFPVVFKPSDDNTTGWGGFYFEDAPDGSVFQWVEIKGATSSAVHLIRSSPIFEYVTFSNNSASYGGAIRVELLANDLHISNSLFLNNFAKVAGGAIHSVGPTGLEEARLVVTESVFRANNAGTTATRQNTVGGAIRVNGNSRIVRSSFRDNEARAYTIYAKGGRYAQGGAIYTSGGRSEIVASSFISNACRMGSHSRTPDPSRAYGGALNLGSGEMLLSNSLLAENELVGGRNPVRRGAGLYVAAGVTTIVNTTMANNSHQAIYRAGGVVEVLNSILFFNNNSGAQIAGTVTATYSAIQNGNGYDGVGNISVNPIFNDLFGIVPPSLAIDAGNPSTEYDDIFPPGQGEVRNDMGYTGGPQANHWNNPACYRDEDGDGFGDPQVFVFMSDCSFGYVSSDTDCDDTDSNAFPKLDGSCGGSMPAEGACGLIEYGEVWSLADSPVRVDCDLNIAELTIEPGVEVHVTGDYEIVVSGVLHSLGTQASPVVFKPAEDNTSGWGGFFFEDAIDGSAFRWTRIEGSNSSAVHLVRSTPLFDHVTFKDNSAMYGGAIRVELLANDLHISNNLFLNNFAKVAGGAIHSVGPTGLEEARLVVTESVFRANNAGTTATRQNTVGGAIRVNGNSRIVRSSFRDNEARAYTIYAKGGRYAQGGAIYTSGGRSEIVASSFISNACRMGSHSRTPDPSRAYGGALNLGSGEMLLSNSLLAENELVGGRNPVRRGAGLYVAAGVTTIVNTTMANNSHQAIYRAGGVVEVLNSILFFNNNSGAQIAGTVTATYSAIQNGNGYDGVGNISVNPIFNDLFGIVPPSLAIDAGNPSTEYDDIFPPGQDGFRNDMGYTGGPNAIFSALPYSGPNKDIGERTLVTLDGSGSADLDGGSFTFLWRQISGPYVDLSSTTATQPSFLAPEISVPTVLSFELVANSSEDVSAPDIVEITVNHVNQTPTADAGSDQVVDERSTASLDGSASNDLDGDSITFLWRQVSGPVVELSDATVAEPTFLAPEVSESTTLAFELVVNDDQAKSDADSVQITVKHVNQPPIADAGPHQVVNERSTASLDGSASNDPDGDSITYLWRQVSGPIVNISDVTVAEPTLDVPEVLVPTQLVFELVVNDGQAKSDVDTVEVTVNRVPIANAGQSQVVDERTSVILNGVLSSDPDGDLITFAWRQIPGPSVNLSSNSVAQPTFDAPEVTVPAMLMFELTVNDGVANSVPVTVVVTVRNVNRVPVADAGQVQDIDEGKLVTLDGTGSSDEDGDALAFIWKQISGPTIALNNATMARPTFLAPELAVSATLTFELVVSDGQTESGADSVTITVNHVNKTPTADAGPDQKVEQQAQVTLDGSGSSDDDGDTLSYTWRQTFGPSVELSMHNVVRPTFVAPEGSAPATLSFDLVVSDNVSDSVADSVDIHIRILLVSDIDDSERVDGFDLGELGLAFGSSPGADHWNPNADLNGDNIIDNLDFDIIATEFGLSQ